MKETRTYRAPLESPVLVDGTVDAPRDTTEPPEGADDGEDGDAEDDLFCAVGETAGGEDEVIQEVAEHQDGEVEGRELPRIKMSMRICASKGVYSRSDGCK